MKIPKGQEKDWCPNYGKYVGQEKWTPTIGKRILAGGSSNALDFKQGYRRPKRIRCKTCGKLLIPKTVDWEPSSIYGEFVYIIPVHKIPKTKRKNPRRRNQNKR